MSKLAIKSSSSADNFSPLASRLKTSWENTTELDRQKCQEKALQGCLLVCEVIAPNAKDGLFQVLSKQSSRESEDDLSKELSGLMTAYRDTPTKSVKLQILSLYAYRFSTEKLMRYHEPYEPLTRWQIKQARKHAKEKGPGIPQEKAVQHRIRLPMAKVDHFIDFVNSIYNIYSTVMRRDSHPSAPELFIRFLRWGRRLREGHFKGWTILLLMELLDLRL